MLSLNFCHRSTPGLVLALSVILAACSSSEPSVTVDQATVDYDLLFNMPRQPVDYLNQVQPVLERRCVVCHGCYDAPCQLKLSSVAGIERGASKETVYNGARITAADPSRLFIDATTTQQWRSKGFYSMFAADGGAVADPVANLENSVMYKMLRLKQLHPQPRVGMLSDRIDTSLGRSQTCPRIEEFDDYAAKFPLQGMPFAMPNLKHDEYAALVQWIAQGTPVPEALPPSDAVLPQIETWEQFLNARNNKQQLVSRYLFEHLFQAHLHFKGSAEREFYRLVRSSTPPGEAVDVVHTRRVYGDPDGPVYYRLQRIQGSIVAKNHLVYEWSDARLQRYRQLFIEPDYEVASLPGYDPKLSANPIRTFVDLPLESRYRFLLDTARFFIDGFIRGPVCRGQIALNVIQDQFWVVFFDPDAPLASKDPNFLYAISDYLASPAEMGDTLRLITTRKHYLKLHQQYMTARDQYGAIVNPVSLEQAMSYLWDGDGDNPNAALTVFRHFDSASVSYGLVGDYPETAWVIDYPLLERIHYLLVAGYDVYGNVGHQLNTRLYMDFLRMEGEDYFLSFLPAAQRQRIRDSWYSGIRAGMENEDINTVNWIDKEYVTGYRSDDVQRELYRHIERRLGPVTGGVDFLNRCRDDACAPPAERAARLRVDLAMRRVAEVQGRVVQYLPEIALLRVRMGGEPEDDLAYSILSNMAYKTVSSMFKTEKPGDERNYDFDTQTVLRHIEGSYPDFFYDVALDEIESFAEAYTTMTTRKDYEKFVSRFGLRRTHPDIWQTSDWFNDYYRRWQPIEAGLLDMNRYQNR